MDSESRNDSLRIKIIDAARSWIGTPYHHAAMVKGAGVDCGMILIAVYSEAGIIEKYTPEYYPSDWMMHRSEEKYLSNVERYAKKTESPQIGDIALFKFGRCISHGGIVSGEKKIIHAYKDARCVIEENLENNLTLKNRLVGYWSVF